MFIQPLPDFKIWKIWTFKLKTFKQAQHFFHYILYLHSSLLKLILQTQKIVKDLPGSWIPESRIQQKNQSFHHVPIYWSRQTLLHEALHVTYDWSMECAISCNVWSIITCCVLQQLSFIGKHRQTYAGERFFYCAVIYAGKGIFFTLHDQK